MIENLWSKLSLYHKALIITFITCYPMILALALMSYLLIGPSLALELNAGFFLFIIWRMFYPPNINV